GGGEDVRSVKKPEMNHRCTQMNADGERSCVHLRFIVSPKWANSVRADGLCRGGGDAGVPVGNQGAGVQAFIGGEGTDLQGAAAAEPGGAEGGDEVVDVVEGGLVVEEGVGAVEGLIAEEGEIACAGGAG